jgi:L,D-peptidoglycan transpeptidase YkuD (ErfK/YbiS/YcfS/YnhG family)
MHLFVKSDPTRPTRGTLTCGGASYPCALGRSGVTTDKKEGDGATPAGTFPLRRVFFRAEQLDWPQTKLPVAPIDPNDGWCDAPQSPSYNQLVRMHFPDSAEYLWRDDHVYDLIVVIGYNDAPVVPGKGSAIFMHIAQPDYAPTEGCVALSRDDLVRIVNQLDATSLITIEAA